MNNDIRLKGRNTGRVAVAIAAAALFALVVSVGISMLPFYASAADTGFNAPTTYSNGTGGNGWTSPENGLVSDNQYATAGSSNRWVTYAGFTFAGIPSNATITGIEVSVEGKTSGRQLETDLSWDNGFHYTSSGTGAVKTTSLTSSEHVVSLGSSSDVWGTSHTWVPSNFSGTPNSSFRVRFTSTGGGSSISVDQIRVKVYFTVPNTAPVASDDSVTTDEDTSVAITLSATDADNDSLTYSIVSNPSHGSLGTILGNQVTYTPDANYNGTDSFTFKANDGQANSNTATIDITVNPVNDAPVAVADVYGAHQDATTTVAAVDGVLHNDTDVEGDSLTASWVSGPTFGYLIFHTDGSFEYAPQAGWSGDDSFVYKANDGTADSNDATVTIHVAANNVPVAVSDAYTTDEDTTLTVAAAGVLSNDTDADSDPLTAVLVSGASHGTLTLNTDGSFTYAPDANYNGTDSFIYKANDTKSDSSDTTVIITVNAVNDAPVAADQSLSIVQDTTLLGSVGATDVDAGDTLTFATTSNPANGTLTFDTATGAFTYTPDSGFAGSDSFSFKANDGAADSNVSTISISVTTAPVENDATLCSDGIDNDNDGLTDLDDPDCAAFVPAPTPTPTPSGNGGGNGGGGGVVGSGPLSIGFVNTNPTTGGQVLGTSTEALPEGCELYLNSYLKQGMSGSEVTKLQTFLNTHLNAGLPVTGFFGPLTFAAVKNFQLNYWDQVLSPWTPFGLGDHTPTGYVYKTTQRMINLIACENAIEIPQPQLP